MPRQRTRPIVATMRAAQARIAPMLPPDIARAIWIARLNGDYDPIAGKYAIPSLGLYPRDEQPGFPSSHTPRPFMPRGFGNDPVLARSIPLANTATERSPMPDVPGPLKSPFARQDDNASLQTGDLLSTIKPAVLSAPNIHDESGSVGKGPVVFVGGAGDRNSAIVYNEYERLKFSHPEISSRYFSHDENPPIENYIKSLPEGAPVTLIGHSWGGDTATQVARALPKRIDTLITIDPVSLFTPFFHSYDSIAKSVRRWINVNAVPDGKPSPGDKVARWGGRWGGGPAGAATNSIFMNAHHEQFSRMLNQLKSYQDLQNLE